MTTEPPSVVAGSCLCRAITYKATGAPLMTTLCHCYNCRKASGAPVMGASVYLVDSVTFSGEYKVHRDTDVDSGSALNRRFCGTCGTQLSAASEAAPQYIGINAGSLDREYVNSWKPTFEQYCVSKADFWPALVKGGEDGYRYQRHLLGAKMAE